MGTRAIYENGERPQRDALRPLIETAYKANPVKTENDLLALGMGFMVAELKIDLQVGRI